MRTLADALEALAAPAKKVRDATPRDDDCTTDDWSFIDWYDDEDQVARVCKTDGRWTWWLDDSASHTVSAGTSGGSE